MSLPGELPADNRPNAGPHSASIHFELAPDYPPDVEAIIVRVIEGEAGLSRSGDALDRHYGGAISAQAKELGFAGTLDASATVDIPDGPKIILVGVGPMPIGEEQLASALSIAVQTSRSLGLRKLATPVVSGTKLAPERVLSAIKAGAQKGVEDSGDFDTTLVVVTPLDFNSDTTTDL